MSVASSTGTRSAPHGVELLGEHSEGCCGLGFVGGPLLGHLGVDDGGVADDSHDRSDPGHDAAAVADPQRDDSPGVRLGPRLLQPGSVEHGDGLVVADGRHVDGLLEHAALVAEVEVDRLHRHPGAGSDLLQRGGVVALGDEELGRGGRRSCAGWSSFGFRELS